jgi:eukaryotic-like serine/threonine-protein kinase
MEARVRDTLARIAARPQKEWTKRLATEFPHDPAMRVQALLWLHAEQHGPEREDDPPSLGETADERYELSLRLDTGATASVWQAFDRKLGRAVAIKVFHGQNESEALDQVIAEARAASDVISGHVVRVIDVHSDGEGHPYIVMELVGEHDPDKGEVVLGAAASSFRPRSIEEVARWVMDAARGVHDAHLRNVFHRDLKPKNVLVTPISRRARVADFGLAVSTSNTDTAHPAITLLKGGPTGPLSVRGTPEYMAPEQARGLPLTLDPRLASDRSVLVAIDVWGLGAIAYDLLCGRPPWLARSDLSAWEIAASNERPPRLDHTRDGQTIPRRLRRVVEKAMATDPTQRYATAAALANELQDFLEDRPTTLDRSRLLRVGLWCRRNPQLALTGLVALALTVISIGAYATVTRLGDERVVLEQQVANQKAEDAQLRRNVELSRKQLTDTRNKLAAEREALAALEQSIEEDKNTYETLLDTKDKALRDANHATRRLVHQLETARRDHKGSEQARGVVEQLLTDARRDVERMAKERERLRRERDNARVERDAMQKERDAAIAERDALDKRLEKLIRDRTQARRP